MHGKAIDRSVYECEMNQNESCVLEFYDNNEYSLIIDFPLVGSNIKIDDNVYGMMVFSGGTYSIKGKQVTMHDKDYDIDLVFEQINDTVLVAQKAFYFLIGIPFIYQFTYKTRHVHNRYKRAELDVLPKEITNKVFFDSNKELQLDSNQDYEFACRSVRLYLYNKLCDFRVTFDNWCLFKGSVELIHKESPPYEYLALTDSATGYTSYAIPNGPYLESDNLTRPDDGICLYKEISPNPAATPTEKPFRRFIRRVKNWLRKIFS